MFVEEGEECIELCPPCRFEDLASYYIRTIVKSTLNRLLYVIIRY